MKSHLFFCNAPQFPHEQSYKAKTNNFLVMQFILRPAPIINIWTFQEMHSYNMDSYFARNCQERSGSTLEGKGQWHITKTSAASWNVFTPHTPVINNFFKYLKHWIWLTISVLVLCIYFSIFRMGGKISKAFENNNCSFA